MKKKIVIPGLCFAALSTVAFEEAVQAAEPPAIKAQVETKYVSVNQGSALNMRSSASASSSVVAKLPRGTKVSVQSESNGWSKVTVNGKSGYVSSQFLTSSSPARQPIAKDKVSVTKPSKAVTKYVSVNEGSALILRSSASQNGSVIARLSRGTKVSVQSESNGWAKVTANGKTGYVSGQFLSASAPAGKPAVNVKPTSQTASQKAVSKYINVNPGSSLNMRSSASTSGSIVARLQRGTKVTVQSESNGWARVKANGKTGYVSSQYLSSSKPSAST
ncbi:SH3 domain-containing protein, partial [Siminovitchia fordii]